MSKNKNEKINVKDNVETNVNKLFDKLDNKKRVYSEIKIKSKPIDEATKKWDMNDKIVDLFKERIEKDNILKVKYAKNLIHILIFQLIALNVLFVMKGLGFLNYSEMSFNIFITGGIAEIYVLVRVIVKYLFKDNLTESLNIILENNNSKKRINDNKINFKDK